MIYIGRTLKETLKIITKIKISYKKNGGEGLYTWLDMNQENEFFFSLKPLCKNNNLLWYRVVHIMIPDYTEGWKAQAN